MKRPFCVIYALRVPFRWTALSPRPANLPAEPRHRLSGGSACNDNRPGAVSGLHGLPTVFHVKSLMDLSTTVNSPAQYVPKRNNCEASMNPRFPRNDQVWLIILCSVLVFWIVAGALVVAAWV